MKDLALLTALALVLVLVGCGTPGAEGPADSFGLDFSMPPGTRLDGAVIFVVDGVNAEVFEDMLAAGKLPAIKRYFVDRGLYAPRAVGSVPSVTLASLTSIATGQFPGHHGITGINWFDRNTLIWRNYDTIAQKNTLDGDYTAATLYEHFPARTSFSVFFQPHRGATKFIENWTSAGPPFFFGWYEFVDRLTLFRLGIVADVARARCEWPAVTFAYLLAPDFRSYDHGVASDSYRDSLKHTDRQIGRVLGDMERAGLLEHIVIALVSDHGHVDVTRHLPLDALLKQYGLERPDKQLWEKTPFEERLEYYSQFASEQYGSGERYWAIQLRQPVWQDGKLAGYRPWIERPDPESFTCYPTLGPAEMNPSLCEKLFDPPGELRQVDLLSLLTAQPAVDVIAWRQAEGQVRVRNAAGEVALAQPDGRGGPISYRVISGEDPLAWHDKLPAEALAGEPMSGRQWLAATIDTRYPDLPEQLLAYFRAQRAGDVIVFASKGWDFGRFLKGGHGGLAPGDMLVPLLVAGPGVPHKRVDVARQVDLVPTLLEALGRPRPAEIDGRSLLGRDEPMTRMELESDDKAAIPAEPLR
jgi:arylsulfatase A-like enzyme